eukprot:GILI01013851.1.p1 GENE.GILI01013851.1~~GILI01013851.1.p1  ORF type:complete len:336 (+),score=77.53 GILI01013851.1:128-1135(+)
MSSSGNELKHGADPVVTRIRINSTLEAVIKQQKSCLVLGCTGQIGYPLAMSLCEEGWKVHGACRGTDSYRWQVCESIGVNMIKFDARTDDVASLPDVDVVFLLLCDREALKSGDSKVAWAQNFDPVARVAERYAGKADLVHGSSIEVYGCSTEPFAEESAATGTDLTELGRVKFALEKMLDYLCKSRGRRVIHLRYAPVESPQVGNILNIGEQIRSGKNLGPYPDLKLQILSLDDFVRMTRRSVDVVTGPSADLYGAVNICHPQVWTLRELSSVISERIGGGTTKFDREAGGDEFSTVGDTNRMLHLFGYPGVELDTLFDQIVLAQSGVRFSFCQ